MMKGGNVLVIKNVKPPAASGQHHRLLCMTGDGKGVSYYLRGNRVVLGRGDSVDVKVVDGKSSREHAEVVKVGKNFVLTDLKSQNGTMVNDLKVNQHTLKDGDKIIIGQTVFKYSIMVVEAPKIVTPVNRSDEEEESETSAPQGQGRRPMIIIVALLLVVVFVFSDGEEGPKGAKKDDRKFQNVTDEFTSMLKKKKELEDRDTSEKLDTILHRGLRELREGNYFRAMAEFQFALTISPNNGRASFYMNKTKQALDSEIEQNLIKARRDQESLKYMSAVQSYCNILRLLEGYGEDDRYKKAEEEIKQLENKMGLDEGEIVCANYGDGKK